MSTIDRLAELECLPRGSKLFLVPHTTWVGAGSRGMASEEIHERQRLGWQLWRNPWTSFRCRRQLTSFVEDWPDDRGAGGPLPAVTELLRRPQNLRKLLAKLSPLLADGAKEVVSCVPEKFCNLAFSSPCGSKAGKRLSRQDRGRQGGEAENRLEIPESADN